MSAVADRRNHTRETSGGDTSDIFDPAEAMDRACDDRQLLTELAELFHENRDRLLEELTKAVACGNARGIDKAAHALKGSVGTFSTKQAYQLARELEFCAKESRLEATPHLLADLKVALAELETAVNSFLSAGR